MRRSRLGWCAAGLGAAALVGCGLPEVGPGPARLVHEPEGYPADFAVALTVFPIENGGGHPGLEVGQRYLVEPGGVLRAGFGAAAARSPVPPVVRTLEREDLSRLATLAASSGLVDLPKERADPFPTTYRPPAGRPTALVYLAWQGDRRYAVDALTEPGPVDVTGLRRLLARLSFRADLAGDEPEG